MFQELPDYIFLDEFNILHKNGFIFDISTSNLIFPYNFHSITYKRKTFNIIKLMILKFYNINLTDAQYKNIKYIDENIRNISLDNISLEYINLSSDNGMDYHIQFSYNLNTYYYIFILYKYDHNNKLLKCYSKIHNLQFSIIQKTEFIKNLLLGKTMKCKKYIWKVEFRKIPISIGIKPNVNYICLYNQYYLSYDHSHIISKITKKILTIYIDIKNHYVYLNDGKKRVKFILEYYSNPNLYIACNNNLNMLYNLNSYRLNNYIASKKIKLNTYNRSYSMNAYFQKINNTDNTNNSDNTNSDDFKINIIDIFEETFDNLLYGEVTNEFLNKELQFN